MKAIEITEKLLSRYVGGQMHTFNPLEDSHYQGEIASIEIMGRKLLVNFAWLAELNAVLDLWVKYDGETTYITEDLNIFRYRSFQPQGRLQLGSSEAEQILCFILRGDKSLLRKIQVVGYHSADLREFAEYLKTLPPDALHKYAAAWLVLGDAATKVVAIEYARRGGLIRKA